MIASPTRLIAAFSTLIVSLVAATSSVAESVDFNRDIRPILSDKCFHCHGPDEANQKADLRLDLREAAVAAGAIVPGAAERSEMVARITAHGAPDDLMPPPDSGRTLSEQEIELLTRWIAEGAEYRDHWAFIPPVKSEPPAGSDAAHADLGAIDRFVLARLQQEGLDFSPRADRATLLRRATLDLTGLPPTLEELDAFLADPAGDEQAFATAVDRLLDSPRYGERMTQYWVEAARYADTDGYQTEGVRTMWPWRDWVIDAFNRNLPYDQFTIEQLAGDRLPDATDQQILASAFNRNHRINNEGGALPEEFIVEYIIDRVETTSTVWLGLTAGCARCHDHKYDPLTQREFYELFAYFNNVPEQGKDTGAKAKPNLMIGSPLLAKDTTELEVRLAEAQAKRQQLLASLPERQAEWEAAHAESLVEFASSSADWHLVSLADTASSGGATLTLLEDGSLLASGANPAKETYTVTFSSDGGGQPIRALMLEALQDSGFTKPYAFSRSTNGNFVLSEVHLERVDAEGKAHAVPLAKAQANYSQAGYPVAAVLDGKAGTGWGAGNHEHESLRAILTLKTPLRTAPDETLRLVLSHDTKFARHHIGRFRLATSSATQPAIDGAVGANPLLIAALSKPAAERSREEIKAVRDVFRNQDPQLETADREIDAIERDIARARGPQVPVMVMGELPADQRRPSYLLQRGLYDQPDTSEALSPGVPASLVRGAAAEEQPADRLELARWLASDRNPLGARVTVNRFWQQHFGVGLVKTAEDFGAQGEWPSHPELLDWLAVDFMEHGWDVKRLHRQIVTSRTYAQSSRVTPAAHQRDPENRLLARGPRFRLDSHAIRDQALAVSGLLNGDLGGPPVMPYQPPGLWSSVANSASKVYKADTGAKLYRRTLYSFWKRAVNPPRQVIFDAQSRDACNVRVKVTNTPLQALALMNDPTFVEAARKLAERMLHEGGETADQRLAWAFRACTARDADAVTMTVLLSNLAHFQDHFAADPEAATRWLSVGEAARDGSLPVAELAAYAATAHLLLNLDATITRE